jgi:hypothetical protein
MRIPEVEEWRRWALLMVLVAVSASCGSAHPKRLLASESGGAGGETAEDDAGGQLCAPECLLFCGTKEECSRSSGGEGGGRPEN